MELVLASGNRGKLRELADRLGERFQVSPQSDWNLDTPEETGTSFLENALLKARYVAGKTGRFAVADDSGLSVDELDGAPGIYSARYAGPNATDQDNIELLLTNMAGVPTERRGCAFHCALVGISPELRDSPILIECRWTGTLREKTAGAGGFGYDPIFQPDGMDCTSAELTPEHKNRISHRGQAMSLLIQRLTSGY